MRRRLLSSFTVVGIGLGVAWACAFDTSLREYSSVDFWLPFAKHAASFERPNVHRISAPFAGMTAAQGDTPLSRLRAAYQKISEQASPFDPAIARAALAAARADRRLTPKDQEEADLIDAKIDMRAGEQGETECLESARKKLDGFLHAAHTPEFLSEARGWLGHVLYLDGDQTGAGKIYLDELNSSGSNLSRETLLNSLRMNYGYDGGPDLLAHLEDYFDTPEHATFAIQLATNPHRLESLPSEGPGHLARYQRPERPAESYARIRNLLQRHRNLFRDR